MKKNISFLLTLFIIVSASFGQTPSDDELTFKKEIIRAVDLREKQNEPLFSADRELSKLLMDATIAGMITPYTSDSLAKGKSISIADFKKSITIDDGSVPQDTAYMDNDEKEEYLLSLLEQDDEQNYFFGKDLYQMEITEDIYFSKNSSEMRYSIKALTIFLPAEHPDNIRGIQMPVASYDFKEVMKIFKDNPDAIWFNPANDSKHLSLEDAFELRMFSSYIIKVSNPSNDYLVDIHGGNQYQGILQAQEQEYEFLEFESNLWEY